MSKNELHDRIESFMQRKESEFPELKLNPDVLIRKMIG
jgi:hypothetical protein